MCLILYLFFGEYQPAIPTKSRDIYLTHDPLSGVRNQGPHWKRRGHRGEEEDTEEDMTKDMDDSSAGASMEEGSVSKNGM